MHQGIEYSVVPSSIYGIYHYIKSQYKSQNQLRRIHRVVIIDLLKYAEKSKLYVSFIP